MTTFELIKKLGDAELARNETNYAKGMGLMEGMLVSLAYESPEIEAIVRRIITRNLDTIAKETV